MEGYMRKLFIVSALVVLVVSPGWICDSPTTCRSDSECGVVEHCEGQGGADTGKCAMGMGLLTESSDASDQ